MKNYPKIPNPNPKLLLLMQDVVCSCIKEEHSSGRVVHFYKELEEVSSVCYQLDSRGLLLCVPSKMVLFGKAYAVEGLPDKHVDQLLPDNTFREIFLEMENCEHVWYQ